MFAPVAIVGSAPPSFISGDTWLPTAKMGLEAGTRELRGQIPVAYNYLMRVVFSKNYLNTPSVLCTIVNIKESNRGSFFGSHR